MFLTLGEMALYRRYPVGPSSTLPFSHQNYMLQGVPLMFLPSVLVVSSTMGMLVLTELVIVS